MRIEGYEHEVTGFDSYDEAQAARQTAMDEDPSIKSAAIGFNDVACRYVVELRTSRDIWYL